MKQCRDCGHDVARSAEQCPHCAAKKPWMDEAHFRMDNFANFLFWLGSILTVLAVLVFFVL